MERSINCVLSFSLSLSLRHFHASVEVEASSSEVSRGDRCCEFVRNGNRFEANGSSSFFFHASTSICRSEDFPIVRLNIKKLNTIASVRITRFRNNSSFLSAAPVRLLFHDLSVFDSTFQTITWNCKAFFLSFLSCRQKTEGFPFRKENYNRPTFDSWPRLNHWRARSE